MKKTILCWALGLHGWKETGELNEFDRMIYRCTRCNLRKSLKPANWSLPGWFYSIDTKQLRTVGR